MIQVDTKCHHDSRLGPGAALLLAGVVQFHGMLTSLNLDGFALPISELKGTKPVESIDLSGKKDKIGVASGIIIAACIKENAVLKELKCAARPLQQC